VYTGAPLPVTTFLAVASKAAGFAMLLRFFDFGVGAAGPTASLGGLPPLAGFLGKFYVFAAGVEARLYSLVVIGLLNSVVSLYYYARIVKVMFLDRPEPTDPPMRFRLVGDLGFVGVLAVANLVLILRFDWLLDLVQSAGRVFMG
jgi:NADH:ubiquinone oxidoreductase subunit 2 (subunit N)